MKHKLPRHLPSFVFTLSLLLITGVSAGAQGPKATPATSPTPAATPTAATPSPTPVTTTVTAAATPTPQNNGAIKINLFGNVLDVNGPVWYTLVVLGVFIAIVIVTLLLARKAREKVNDALKMTTTKWIVVLLLGIAVVLTIGVVLGTRLLKPASTVTSTPPTPAPSPCPIVQSTLTTTPSPSPTPFTLSVSSVRGPFGDQVAEFGDTITVTVSSLKEELAREVAQHVEQTDPRKYVLFLNTIEVKKLHPVGFDPDKGELTFTLNRTPESKEVWSELLASQTGPTRNVKVSVGPESRLPISSDQTLTLYIYGARLYVAVAASLIAIVLLVLLARKTNILRDSEPLELPPDQLRPFSLARSQAAWWLIIICGSFVFLWIVTGDFANVTNSSVVLVGIASSTFLLAKIIDVNKNKLTPETLLTAKPRQSEGFISDILTDVHGITLYRFQMVGWSIVMGVIFVWSVWKNLSMPEVSDTLLTLTGISAGTYIGLKIPERQIMP